MTVLWDLRFLNHPSARATCSQNQTPASDSILSLIITFVAPSSFLFAICVPSDYLCPEVSWTEPHLELKPVYSLADMRTSTATPVGNPLYDNHSNKTIREVELPSLVDVLAAHWTLYADNSSQTKACDLCLLTTVCCKVSPLKHTSSPPLHCSFNFLLLCIAYILHFLARGEE